MSDDPATATSFRVLVMDMFHYQDREHEMIVGGFPTLEEATEYARRRVRDSIERLRQSGQSKEELRRLWHAFGEDVVVIARNGYAGANELDEYLDHPATMEERDYLAIEKRLTGRLYKTKAS